MDHAKELEKTIRELLVAELGEFAPGKPAVAIEPPIAPNTGNGLYASISRQPNKLSQSLSKWDVTLRQYDRTELGWRKFDGAIAKMRKRFPLSSETILPFAEDRFSQATFSIDVDQYFVGSAIAENK